MNKNKIILILTISIIVLSIILLENSRVSPKIVNVLEDKMPKEGRYPKAPELISIKGYINTGEDIKISELKGKVVLIDFWTYTCINCIRTLPHLKEWDKKYRDKGLVIIGVHTPEFEFEKDYNNVKKAVEENNIKYAVVQDNDYATWSAYKNRFWPRKYLIDSEGFIRYDHIGEGAYKETEKQIQQLLSEIGKDITNMDPSSIPDFTPLRETRTPELYAGYKFALPRNQNIGNSEGLQPNQITSYTQPTKISKDTIYLTGSWKSNQDDLLAQGESSIILDFTARSVNIVADSTTEPIEMEILIDNQHISKEQAGEDVQFKGEKSFILIDSPKLYNIYKGEYVTKKLELKTSQNFFFSAFTFG